MGNELKEKVLELVRLKGPVTPTIITQEIRMDTFISSALLSELVGNDQIRISNVKVGSTPLYYAPGQEEKLQEYMKYLHDKEKQAFELLKKEQVLKDQGLDPVVRVALREIKDFAKPLSVQADGVEQLFWKWYLLSNEQAEPLIKNLLGMGEPAKETETAEPEVEKEVEETIVEEQAEPVVKKELESETTEQQTTEPAQEEHMEVPEKKTDTKSTKKENKSKEKKEKQKKLEEKEEIETPKADTAFTKKINTYFKKNQVEIVQELDIKKTEASYIISVPSSVGSVRYYCKIKDKKSNNEGDLSTAYVIGENKKLPVLYLTTGELTKKASEMLEEEFSTLNVKQI